jgi:hypothetical protein
LDYPLDVSLEQIEASILELSPEEQRHFAAWYEAHRTDLVPDLQAGEDLTEEQKAEVLRRRDLALAHPELLESWVGTIERVRGKLHELRRQNSPGG